MAIQSLLMIIGILAILLVIGVPISYSIGIAAKAMPSPLTMQPMLPSNSEYWKPYFAAFSSRSSSSYSSCRTLISLSRHRNQCYKNSDRRSSYEN